LNPSTTSAKVGGGLPKPLVVDACFRRLPLPDLFLAAKAGATWGAAAETEKGLDAAAPGESSKGRSRSTTVGEAILVVCNVDPCNVWGWSRLPVVMYGGGGLATKARARVSLTKFV